MLCGATNRAEMAAFGRSKERIFKDFLNLKHSIPSHDTFSTVLRMIDPKALDAAFGQVLARITSLLGEGGGDYCLALKANQDSLLSDAGRVPARDGAWSQGG